MSDWGTAQGASVWRPQGTIGSGTSSGVQIQAHTSADQWSVWREFDASTPTTMHGLVIHVQAIANTLIGLLKLGRGQAGYEVDLLDAMLVPMSKNGTFYGVQAATFYLPITIPSGTRLAFQHAGTAANQSYYVTAQYMQSTWAGSPLFTQAKGYGWNLAAPQGTALDPGGTPNTKGAYAPIVSSTGFTIHALTVVMSDRGASLGSSHEMLVDVARGASGQEVNIFSNMEIASGGAVGGVLSPGVMGPYPCYIPAGTRLSARMQSTTTTLADITLIAFG
jgi:hypothetical protein